MLKINTSNIGRVLYEVDLNTKIKQNNGGE
jgi:hypothetical protein